LNQDATYDKKDDADTDKKPKEKEAKANENSKIVVNKEGSHLNNSTQFTGEITI
jgi:hypothetical protein